MGTEAAVFLPSSFLVDGTASGWCSQGCQGIVDTGTSLLTMPSQYLSDILQAIGAEEEYGEVSAVGRAPPSSGMAVSWGGRTVCAACSFSLGNQS